MLPVPRNTAEVKLLYLSGNPGPADHSGGLPDSDPQGFRVSNPIKANAHTSIQLIYKENFFHLDFYLETNINEWLLQEVTCFKKTR